ALLEVHEREVVLARERARDVDFGDEPESDRGLAEEDSSLELDSGDLLDLLVVQEPLLLEDVTEKLPRQRLSLPLPGRGRRIGGGPRVGAGALSRGREP